MNEMNLIDECFQGMKDKHKSNHVEKTTLTLWVPTEYKRKFEELQDKTKKDFGKRLQKLLIKAIDTVSTP